MTGAGLSSIFAGWSKLERTSLFIPTISRRDDLPRSPSTPYLAARRTLSPTTPPSFLVQVTENDSKGMGQLDSVVGGIVLIGHLLLLHKDPVRSHGPRNRVSALSITSSEPCSLFVSLSSANDFNTQLNVLHANSPFYIRTRPPPNQPFSLQLPSLQVRPIAVHPPATGDVGPDWNNLPLASHFAQMGSTELC